MQIGQQAFVDDALAQGGVFHGPGHLNASLHVAVHPVGACQIQVLGAGNVEIEHARMFQQPPDDGAHADVVRNARQLRGQHARAAHDEVDVRALLPGVD